MDCSYKWIAFTNGLLLQMNYITRSFMEGNELIMAMTIRKYLKALQNQQALCQAILAVVNFDDHFGRRQFDLHFVIWRDLQN